jgi:hypothetical protein
MLSLALDGDEMLSMKRLSTAALPLCEMRTSVCMYVFINSFIVSVLQFKSC